MPGRIPRWLVAAVVGGMVLAGVAVVPPPRPVAAATSCRDTPFTHGFADYVAARWPANRISVAVYDDATGCEYTYRPELRLTTASVIKIEIMAAVLLRAQRAGRGLTQWEKDRIWPMITESANTPASELWYSLGGVGGMQAFERELGLTETVAAGPTWGLTTTSATDRNKVLRQVLLGEYGPLNATSRAIARSYMLKVIPSQRWGATAGVPDGYAVALKNGFFDSTCCNWRINTSAVIERPNGSHYALTVMSDGWPSDRPGIDAVEFVSRVVNAAIAKPFGPFASTTSFVRQQYRDILGRSPTFGEIYIGTQYVGQSGALAAKLIEQILQSAELDSSGRFVLRLYLGTLGRLPDYAAYRQRRDRVHLGLSTQLQQAQAFATNPTVVGTPTPTDAQFVDTMYERAVGHPPSPSVRAHWIERLGLGVPRGAVLLKFTESPEAIWRQAVPSLVAAAVLSMLQRPPRTHYQDWIDRLRAGEPLSTLAGELFHLPEYRARF
jgi:beta-lactamase class A